MSRVLSSYRFDDYPSADLPQIVKLSSSLLTLYVFGKTPDFYGEAQVFLEIWLWGAGSRFLPTGTFDLEIESSEILKPISSFVADKVFVTTGSMMLRGWCAVYIGRIIDEWRWSVKFSYNSDGSTVQIYGVSRSKTIAYRQKRVPVTSNETRDDQVDEASNAISTRPSPSPVTSEETRGDWVDVGWQSD